MVSKKLAIILSVTRWRRLHRSCEAKLRAPQRRQIGDLTVRCLDDFNETTV